MRHFFGVSWCFFSILSCGPWGQTYIVGVCHSDYRSCVCFRETCAKILQIGDVLNSAALFSWPCVAVGGVFGVFFDHLGPCLELCVDDRGSWPFRVIYHWLSIGGVTLVNIQH